MKESRDFYNKRKKKRNQIFAQIQKLYIENRKLLNFVYLLISTYYCVLIHNFYTSYKNDSNISKNYKFFKKYNKSQPVLKVCASYIILKFNAT